MPRFSYALLGALALHGLLLLARSRHARDASAVANTPLDTQSVELEEVPLPEAPLLAAPDEQTSPAAPLLARAEPRAPSAAANHSADPLSKASAEVEASPAGPDADAPAAPVAAASAGEGDGQPARKIDLGLDGHFFIHDQFPTPTREPARASELGPRARKSTVQQQLQAALSADDVRRGLARGNALLGSLNEAARAEGPLRGEAMFRATVAADGSFGNVELVRGMPGEWSAVVNAFRQLAARKHVRVPPGAKGLRVTFTVKAKVQYPSGKEANESAISAADPSLGPNGAIPRGDFDLADLGSAAQRIVYARIVSEEVL